MTESDDPLRGLNQAYADTFENQDSRERCLDFLMPGWVGETGAKRALMLIGEVGTFSPDLVEPKIEDMVQADPEVRFTFGRENSVVLYIETEYPVPITQIIEQVHPQELYQLDDDEPLGNVRTYDEPHSNCHHDSPPIEDGDWAAKENDDATYIRAWWDND